MFHYGIKVLEVQQGMKSYHAVKLLSPQQIGEVKTMIEHKEVLGLWHIESRDMDMLQQWQQKMKQDQASLNAAGVQFDLYVQEDTGEWFPVDNLDALLAQDAEQLTMLLDIEAKITASWQRFREDGDTAALDDMIGMMPEGMRDALYSQEDDHRTFARMIQHLIPEADESEGRMLSYEFHSHVKRQAMMQNLFTATPPAVEPEPETESPSSEAESRSDSGISVETVETVAVAHSDQETDASKVNGDQDGKLTENAESESNAESGVAGIDFKGGAEAKVDDLTQSKADTESALNSVGSDSDAEKTADQRDMAEKVEKTIEQLATKETKPTLDAVVSAAAEPKKKKGFFASLFGR